MSEKVIVTGMVIKTMPIGEYDKRVTLLTREYGKISAFARGARRPNSQLLAATEPFAFGSFELFEGKSSYTISKVQIENYFRSLSADPIKVCYGFYFLELAEYFGQENVDASEQLLLLYQTLRALESGRFDSRLVRCIYELKTLSINGECPNVFRCVKCGAKESLTHLQLRMGGVLCCSCEKKYGGSPIDRSTLYTMQFIISTPIARLYSFKVSDKVQKDLEKTMEKSMELYVGHMFQSLKILTDMIQITK